MLFKPVSDVEGALRSRVFVSCGQATRDEIRVANKIGQLLAKRGYSHYIAKNVQNVFEINSGIIGELKNSDCYLFVNFRRDRLGRHGDFSGSLFSNQEFAIAYAMGFERILVINQKGVRPEGMLAYIGCNTDEFDLLSDCLRAVRAALDEVGWSPAYSRRLVGQKLCWSEEVAYSDGLSALSGRILYLEIANRRPDTAALETTARLARLRRAGVKTWTASNIQSPLKATKRQGYAHTIFPNSSEAFDLLCIGTPIGSASENHVFLNSALDVTPKPYLPVTPGTWELEYEFYAIGFPVLRVGIKLTWPGDGQPVASILRQENI